MEPTRIDRKLTAILSADVKGYSRLMAEDEVATIRTLTAHRELMDSLIQQHRGRVVDTPGDNLLAEFGSVVDAVQCAVEIQRELHTHNAELPEARKMEFRIGINLGDVIVEGERIFGDGVNIAARMEGLAEGGGICISGAVFDQIKGKVSVNFEDLGPQEVKNIAEPIRAYQVRMGTTRLTTAPSVPSRQSAQLPSVAVLPFNNLSGDPDQDYFSDGIAEDIISALSRIRFLLVIARNSSFTYKGQSPDIRKVARELGTRYVLEGSVRKASNRVRIAVQLIEGETGNHLWAERYDRELDNIFDVQDDITEAVVGTLQPELGKAEQERAKAKRTDSLDAWDAYQRGMWHTNRRTKDDLATGIQYFQRSIDLELEFAPAHWGSTIAYFYTLLFGWADSREEMLDKVLAVARRAVELDPEDSMSHTALGYAHFIRREHRNAISTLETAIERDPNNYLAPRMMGMTLTGSGRASEAPPHLHHALRLSPRDPLVGGTLSWLAMAYFFNGESDVAVEFARRGVRNRQAPQTWTVTTLITVLSDLGLRDEAQETCSELLRTQPNVTCSFVHANIPISDANNLEGYIDGLRKAGLPE